MGVGRGYGLRVPQEGLRPQGHAASAELSRWESAADTLLRAAHLAAPHELPDLIGDHAEALGGSDPVMYLADLQQFTLVPFARSAIAHSGPPLTPLPIDSTLAGRAYQHMDVLTQSIDVA